MNKPIEQFNMISPLMMKKSMDDFKKQTDTAMKHKFSAQIKGNFLIGIMNAVIQQFGGDLLKYYDFQMTEIKMVDGSYEHADYDICRHIVGIHRANLIFETTEKRKQFEESSTYQANQTYIFTDGTEIPIANIIEIKSELLSSIE